VVEAHFSVGAEEERGIFLNRNQHRGWASVCNAGWACWRPVRTVQTVSDWPRRRFVLPKEVVVEAEEQIYVLEGGRAPVGWKHQQGIIKAAAC